MHRIRPSFKLAIVLAWLSLTGVMAAQWLGVSPDVHKQVLAQRIALSENLAVNCSLFLRDEAFDSIETSLLELTRRNSDILAAEVRRVDGRILAQAGDPVALGDAKAPAVSSDRRILVPLLQNEEPWGRLEVVFKPITVTWFYGLVDRDWAQSLLLIAAINGLLFGGLLWKVLYELDPSRAAPSRVRAAFDALTEGLLVLDNQGRIAMANRSISNAIGQTPEALVGKEASSLPFTPAKPGPLTWRDMTLAKSELHGVEMTSPGKEGVHTFMVNCSPILEGDGGQRGLLITFDDITELASRSRELVYMLDVVRESRDKIKEQNEELRFLATRDPLTGCLNRRSFFEQFEAIWSGDSHAGQSLGSIMVDIDRFKSINDQYGHAAGDETLRVVAKILRESIGSDGLVCRYGGEEFAILLTGATLESAEHVAESLRAQIGRQQICGEPISASLGVSHYSLGARSPEELLEQSDQALYFSKRTGRDRVTRFDRLKDAAAVVAPAAADAAAAKTASTAESAAPIIPEVPAAPIDIPHRVPYHAVSSLLSALAYRDPETAAHCMRVADLSVAVSRGLMSTSDAYLLEIGALLHDVGKIGVPDAVLLKPGPLTDEEWVLMQRHDRIGVEIVSASFTCPELTEIIRCHHAWYAVPQQNGALPTGEDIPIRARIISIADAYDAMVTDRVYRKGRSMEEAFAELRKMAGVQFDPALVERFIEVVGSRAPRRSEPGVVDKEVTLSLCLQTERMARAVDERDLEAIRALAQHLELIAAKSNLPSMQELAAEIGRTAADERELPQLIELVHDLMELCLAAQDATLRQDCANSQRGV